MKLNEILSAVCFIASRVGLSHMFWSRWFRRQLLECVTEHKTRLGELEERTELRYRQLRVKLGIPLEPLQ